MPVKEEPMEIRKITKEDIDDVMKIYEDARTFMVNAGNPNQWVGHPKLEHILSDLVTGCGYVVCENDEIIGAFHFKLGTDPTYLVIEEGEWKNDLPYAVIHRIAVKYHGHGIADFIYNYCFNIRQNLRIDTHKDNIPMQKSLLKNGFEYCGIIHIASGDERLAYQKAAKD